MSTAFLFQQMRSCPQQPPPEYNQNNYEGPVDLVKITTSPQQTDG